MITHTDVKRLALNGVNLLLYMDASSYRPDVLQRRQNDPNKLILSPLHNECLSISEMQIGVAGPVSGMGPYDVVINMMANGQQVSAYCNVQYGNDDLALMTHTVIYVDNVQLSPRNVTFKYGRPSPMTLAKEYDIDHAIAASTYQGDIG